MFRLSERDRLDGSHNQETNGEMVCSAGPRCWPVHSDALADRLKDMTSIAGVRSNQLVGYGVVVGLVGQVICSWALRCSLCSQWCRNWGRYRCR